VIASATRRLGVLLCLAAAGGSAAAGDNDKSQYNLFNPTPRSQMREMTTDRPDITEVPFTVDAGHVQTESTLFGYARTRPDIDGAESDIYEFAYTNVRIGLTNNIELSLVWQPYGIVNTNVVAPEPDLNQSGVGHVDIRAKFNLWGNDDFEKVGSAFALLPVITLPTDPDNGIGVSEVEGGVAAFLALALPAGFGIGFNAGTYAIQDEDGTGYHAEYLATMSGSYEWTDKFATYAEVVGIMGMQDPRGDILLIGAGWTYALTDDVQLDGGVNFGVTDASDRYNPFLGLSMRF
jgi:hypothetical protein